MRSRPAVRAPRRRPLRPAAQGALFYFGVYGAAAAYGRGLLVAWIGAGLMTMQDTLEADPTDIIRTVSG